MPRLALLSVVYSAFLLTTSGQTMDDHDGREERIQEILHLQDRRTLDDGLRTALSDPDAAIRERALIALANIQDSAQIGLLVSALRDPVPEVQFAAAFAVGQTGTVLSLAGRRALEAEILSAPPEAAHARSRLVEELGKFGTVDGLRELLRRFAPTDSSISPVSLCMSIARFAIRDIHTEESVSYLLRVIRPIEHAPWQAVYALQRTGDHPIIRRDLDTVILLEHHADPLVRLNCAALLGEFHGERIALNALRRIAEYDRDWRVRVNALRSLCKYDLRQVPEALQTLEHSFVDAHPLVALSALAAVSRTALDLRDSTASVRRVRTTLCAIAANVEHAYPWQMQGEAAMTVARLLETEALPLLPADPGTSPYLTAELLRAVALAGDPSVLPALERASQSPDPIISIAALEGMGIMTRRHSHDQHVKHFTYRVALERLTEQNVGVVATAAGLLGEELLQNTQSVQHLVRRLSTLRVPDDVEALQEICRVLETLRDTSAVSALVSLLGSSDRTVAESASHALTSITGTDYGSQIPPRAEPLHTDFDFPYLSRIPDTLTVLIDTEKGTIAARLEKTVAPFTVLSFVRLALDNGFYNGIGFHRVVPNFVVQGGDPQGDGWGGPGYSIRSEFSSLRFDTGTLGMASAGKDTEGSQFFITHSPQPHLEGRYTIFGSVISGQDVVDRLLVGDKILRITISE